MNKADLHEKIVAMPFVDTHNHLIESKLIASDFWEIGEYMWLLRHLRAGGYTQIDQTKDFDERAKAYFSAFKNAENTVWCQCLKTIFKDIFNVELKKASDIMIADEAIKSTYAGNRTDEIINKTSLLHFVVNGGEEPKNKKLISLIPRIEYKMKEWTNVLFFDRNLDLVKEDINKFLNTLSSPGIMTSCPIRAKSNEFYLTLDFLCADLKKRNMFLELFMGIENGIVYEHDISELYPYFSKYSSLKFNLVTASQPSNLDIVSASNIFPNVYAGGLWWYNYRPSAYFEAMQYRMENMPMTHSSLIASDARCLEWCYGKSIMVKKMLAGFMCDKLDILGDEDLILRVCESWLSNTSKALLHL